MGATRAARLPRALGLGVPSPLQLVGSSLRLRGWLERMGERSATFRVQACDTDELVCEAAVTLVALLRTVIETRIAAKREALQRRHPSVGMAP